MCVPRCEPVAAGFIVFGFYAGAFAVAAIDIERTFDLSDAATRLPARGGDHRGHRRRRGRRHHHRPVGRGRHAGPGSVIIWGSLLMVEALAPHIALFVARVHRWPIAAGGLVDVVINVTSADALAREPGKLVRFHGLWNFACVLGATGTGIVLRLGGSWRGGVGGHRRRRDHRRTAHVPRRVPEPARVEHPSMIRALIGLRHEGLTVLALVFAASAMVEGGVATWGVLYLRAHDGLGVLAGVGAYVVGNLLATARASAVRRSSTSSGPADGHVRCARSPRPGSR